MAQRNFFNRKSDLILILAVLAAALVFGLWYLFAVPSDSPVAVITVDGEVVRTLELSHAKDQSFSLLEDTGVPVSFEVSGHRIRFINVTCPDHLCEKMGFVSRVGETAVCMPNKTILSIQEKRSL